MEKGIWGLCVCLFVFLYRYVGVVTDVCTVDCGIAIETVRDCGGKEEEAVCSFRSSASGCG